MYMADLKNKLWKRISVNLNGFNRDLATQEKKLNICYSYQLKLFLASITKILLSRFQASSY